MSETATVIKPARSWRRKLYKLTYQCEPEPGHCLEFFANERSAKVALHDRKQFARVTSRKCHSESITTVDVKLTKNGIIMFLNWGCLNGEDPAK